MDAKVTWSARLLRIVCAITLALMLVPVNAFQAMAESTEGSTASTQAADQVATSDSSEGGAVLETSSDSSSEATVAETTEAVSAQEGSSNQAADSSAAVEAPVASQSEDDGIMPMADNGLTVKWIITDKWSGTGTAQDYTMTPAGGTLGIQATVGINSSVAYPKGKATFTIPKTLLTYRDGTTCDIVSMGVQPKNPDPNYDYGSASYWYYEDDGNGNYVFTNCQEIPSNDAKAFSITYSIDTNKVAADTVATIAPNTSGTSPALATSSCKITFASDVNISSFAKTVINNGNGERALPAASSAAGSNYWFGRPASGFNFSDNFYFIYRLDTSTTGNEPHTVSWTDTLTGYAGAKIVGMSIDGSGLHYVKPIEAATGSYTYGEYDANNNLVSPANPTVANSGNQYCYVLAEYPKNSIPPLQAGQSAKFTDTGTATIKGIDHNTPKTETDTKEATWTKSQPGSGGGAGSDKAATSHDMLGAAAMLFNDKDVVTPKFVVTHWSWDADKTTTPSTQAVRNGYIIDDTLTVKNPTIDGYTVLKDGDYYLNSLVFAQGVTDAAWSDEADAWVGNSNPGGVFEIYGATTKDGAYSLITTRTVAQINSANEADRTIDLGTNKYVQWYVVYKGDTSATPQTADGMIKYSCYADYVLVGSSPTWNTLLPNDTTGITLDNSAAMPATNAATGKLTDLMAADQSATYMNTWSPEATPDAQKTDLLAKDQAAWGSLYPASRPAGADGLPRAWGGALVGISPVEGMNTHAKWQTNATENDKPNARAITNFQMYGGEYYNVTGETLDVNINELSLSLARDEAVFYDLLPAGMKYFEDDAHPTTAQGITNDISADVSTNVITNYKGTGRDLLVFTVSNPVNATNPGVGNSYVPAGKNGDGTDRAASGPATGVLYSTALMQTGFRVNYSTYTPYDSMSDVSVIPSDTAYQLTDNKTMLGTAYADQVDMGDHATSLGVARGNIAPHNTIKAEDGSLALNNLKGIAGYDPDDLKGRTLDTTYNKLTTPVVVDFQASSGLTKKVAPNEGDGAGIYVDDTKVEVGKDYTYRMQYTNSDYIEVQDMVVYDNLETANAAATHWQGTLKSFNTTVAEAKGIKPLIYVSTEPTTSLALYDKSADKNDFTKWTVNDPWQLYDPDAAEGDPGYFDLADVKAVAIDLGWTDDAQTARFTLPQLGALSVGLVFTAPESLDLDDDVNTAAEKRDGKAYNYAGVSMVYKITTGGEGTATTVSDPGKFTSVELFDPRVYVPMTKVDDQTTPAAVPGAQFKIDQEAPGGRTPVSEDVWSATAADATTVPAIAIGDLVFNNTETDDTTDPPTVTTTPTPLKLAPGTYYMTETTAPDGFVLDETEYKIVVTAGDDTVDPPVAPKVEIYKGTETTPIAANDDGKVEIVNPKIDVTINKVLTSTEVAEDGTVEYKITLKNNGNSDLTDYTITDTMTGLDYVSSTPTEGITYTAATDTAPASFKIAKLEAGKELTITVKAKVTADQWKNQVNPTVKGEPNTDKVRVTDATGATEATDTPAVGDTVYYKLTLKNTGTGELAAGYETTDTFTGMRYVGTDAAVVDNGDGTLTWTTADAVAVDGEATIVLPFIVQPTITGEGDDVTVTLISNSANGVAVSEKVANVTQKKELTDVSEDGQLTYTITLKNSGGKDATDFKVKDAMTNLDYVSHTPAAPDVTWDPATSIFTVATVPAGGEVVITVVCEPAGDGAVTNALVPVDPSDPSLSKVRITSETDTTPATDVPYAGQVVYYQLKVDNSMADARAWAEGEYVISDKFEGMTYVGDDAAITVEEDGTLTWEVPAMAAGDVKTIIVPMMIDDVTLKDGESVTTTYINNTANNVIVSEFIANVTYDKVLESADMDANTVTYTITLNNTGNVAAKDFKVSDTMTGLTYNSSTCVGANATYANGEWTFDTVPVGEKTVVLTVVCTITDDAFSNALAPLGGKPEVNKERVNEDGTPATDTPTGGQTIYYLLTANNDVDNAIDYADGEFTVDDTYEGMKYLGTDPAIVDNGDGTLTWSVPAMAAGEVKTIIVPMKINTTGEDGEVTTYIDNKASNTVVGEKIANVSVVKELVTPATSIGGTATYTLTLSNNGAIDATNFKLVDDMTNITYASHTVTTGSASATWDGSGFTISKVPVGKDTVVLTVMCTTTAASYSNHASTIVGDEDPVLSKVRVDENGAEAANTPVVGDTVYYKITLDNTKGTKTADAGQVFKDTYVGLTFVSAKGEGTVNADGTEWIAPEVAAGSSVSTIMSFTVDETTSNFISNKISSDDETKTTVTGDTVTQKPIPVKAAAKSAKTGDDTMVFGGAALVVLMLMAGGAAYARRRSLKD